MTKANKKNNYIYSFIRTLIRAVARKILPIKKNQILFTSFGGQYSDSPKFISEKIHAIAPSLKQVWLLKKQNMNGIPDYIKIIDIDNQIKCFFYKATSQILIDNVYAGNEIYLREQNLICELMFKITRWANTKQQFIFTTWHGTPLKKMGRDQIGNQILDFECPNTNMILGNQYTLDTMKHLTFDKIKMTLLGTPRNDILFYSHSNLNDLKEKLKLPNDKKIILYAPTFRNDGLESEEKNVYRSGLNQLEEMNLGKLFQTLNRKFGGEWVLVCRFHYHVASQVNWEMLSSQYPGQIINGNLNGDMSEYLVISDILLTDASSCMFDFALTKKPCFIYFPDLYNYEHIERGFYIPIETLPFKTAIDFESVLNNISCFNKNEYVLSVDNMLRRFEYVDDAYSSEKVAKYILKQIKNIK